MVQSSIEDINGEKHKRARDPMTPLTCTLGAPGTGFSAVPLEIGVVTRGNYLYNHPQHQASSLVSDFTTLLPSLFCLTLKSQFNILSCYNFSGERTQRRRLGVVVGYKRMK